MSFFQISLLSLTLILFLMTLLWLYSLRIKNASIVDIFWGTGFAITAWFYCAFAEGFLPRNLLLASLVTIWGLRLSIHIFRRNHGQPEDFRYRTWREEHGAPWTWWSWVQVFALQGLILWIVSLPLLAGMMKSNSWSIFDGLGLALWLVGFVFEAGGDYQLARFKANPANKGKLLTTGLWMLTRHPNYFGDAVVWWGHFCFALPGGGWTVFAPFLMTFLLLRVSGVTMLEKTMKVRPGYEAYTRDTPAFFPKLVMSKKK
jgi:steroid 5-alpha reductase family enzyme